MGGRVSEGGVLLWSPQVRRRLSKAVLGWGRRSAPSPGAVQLPRDGWNLDIGPWLGAEDSVGMRWRMSEWRRSCHLGLRRPTLKIIVREADGNVGCGGIDESLWAKSFLQWGDILD